MSDNYRILVVDDTEENIIYFSQILEEHGYTYGVARNGVEALKMMEKKIPELVLLDIMMPRKSGFGVFKKMKDDPRLENIPIIVCTGASGVTGVNMTTGEEDTKDGYEDEFMRNMGTNIRKKMQKITPDAYVEKPIEPQILVSQIKKLLP